MEFQEKATNRLRREVDRLNRTSMTEEEKERRRACQRQLYWEKKRRTQWVFFDYL
ncbi:hypothetical protein Sjap_021191 [Stephania japonica]|uniref:Uncharacterized protein n=1 Tax=Stephania japonica TaxID=461633 RepID=A0AAP0F7Q9_9MAGN